MAALGLVDPTVLASASVPQPTLTLWAPSVPGLAPGCCGTGEAGTQAAKGGWQSPWAQPERRVQVEGAPHALLHTTCPGKSPATR